MVRFGVAGYPPAFNKSIYRKDRIRILNWLSDLGLDAFEIQMTYGPRTKPETCAEYRRLADHLGIKISIHASYYIVLTSPDAEKVARSIETLERTFQLAEVLGADTVVLHPGSYYGNHSEVAKEILIESLNSFFSRTKSKEIGLFLETAGKLGQFGSVEEILDVCTEVDGSYPCIDFGHVHARSQGQLRNQSEIDNIIAGVERYLMVDATRRVHFHYTPINYGPRGEIGHKSLTDKYPTDMQMSLLNEKADEYYLPRYEPIIDSIGEANISCTIISETFNSQEEGALAMKTYYQRNKDKIRPLTQS